MLVKLCTKKSKYWKIELYNKQVKERELAASDLFMELINNLNKYHDLI